MTFGTRIKQARLEHGLTQRELAGLLQNSTGDPLSASYLFDLEQGNRAPPPSYLIEQFATVLMMPREVLYFEAGRLPPDYCGLTEDHDLITKAYAALRAELLCHE